MDMGAKWRVNDKERKKKRKEAGGLGDNKEVILKMQTESMAF